MKKLTNTLIVALCVVTSLWADEDNRTIYSYKSQEAEIRIRSIDGYNYWKQGKGKEELTLILSDSSKKSINSGICGLLCGVLIEGMATQPSDVVLNLKGDDNYLVKFSNQGNLIVIRIDGLEVRLNRDEAKRLVDVLLRYWGSVSK
jgi:hypothetical protein